MLELFKLSSLRNPLKSSLHSSVLEDQEPQGMVLELSPRREPVKQTITTRKSSTKSLGIKLKPCGLLIVLFNFKTFDEGYECILW